LLYHKDILPDDIDSIEWSSHDNNLSSNNILFGSKKEQVYKLCSLNDKFELLSEMNLKKNFPNEKVKDVISFNFLPGSNIATACSNKLIIQHYNDSFNEVKSDQIHEFSNPITHFKLLENGTNNYIVYTSKYKNDDKEYFFNTQQ